MTKQEMLAEVEAKIREDIPRLMELKEGCKLWFSDSHNSCLIKIIAEDKEKDCFYVLEDSYNFEEYTKDFINKYFEIIGHDIMLNDVLEWLNNKFYEKDYFITSKGIFGYRAVEYDTIETYILRDIKINLHFPYLKDQSEELIKFLYNLIKE